MTDAALDACARVRHARDNWHGTRAPSRLAVRVRTDPPPAALDIILVGVRRSDLAIGVALVVEAALRLGFALLVLLAVAAQPRKRHREQPLLGDLQPARFARPVGALVHPCEGVVDLLDLDPFAIRQDEVDFTVALFGGE